jgi:hypothetical protein
MYGVSAKAMTSVWAVTIKRISERKHDTTPDETGGPDDRRRVNEIECPNLIVGTPPAPVSDFLGRRSPVPVVHDREM